MLSSVRLLQCLVLIDSRNLIFKQEFIQNHWKLFERIFEGETGNIFESHRT